MIPPVVIAALKSGALKILTNKWLWIVLAIVGVYFYISFLRGTVADLKEERDELRGALTSQIAAYENLKRDFNQILQLRDEYQEKARALEKEKDKLEDVLYRERKNKQSLEQLILKDKKRRVEKLINKASANVLRCLEITSGAPIKEEEKIDCNVDLEGLNGD